MAKGQCKLSHKSWLNSRTPLLDIRLCSLNSDTEFVPLILTLGCTVLFMPVYAIYIAHTESYTSGHFTCNLLNKPWATSVRFLLSALKILFYCLQRGHMFNENLHCGCGLRDLFVCLN